MKCKILPFLLLWLIAAVANGQIIGSTTYDLRTSIITDSTTYYSSVSVDDANEFTISPGSVAKKFGWHGASYGMNVKQGNQISFKLSSSAVVTFAGSVYASSGYWVFTNESGVKIDSISTVPSADLGEATFSYTGVSQTITATCTAGQAYLPYVIIANADGASNLNGAVQVWDFGAEQLTNTTDTTYINMLSESIINGWYSDTITVIAAGYTLPDFTAGELSWTGKPTSDRLRTSNTNLIRYDDQISSVNAPYTGRIYVNGSALTTRFISLTLLEDDEITIAASSQNGTGILNFVNTDGSQTDTVNLTKNAAKYNFVAKTAGTYYFYDTFDKPSYMRVYRKNAEYVTVSGSVSVPTEIPSDYTVIYTNEAGKTWTATPVDGAYSVTVPAGFTYAVSLGDANGFVISGGSTSLNVTDAATNDLTITAVTLYTVTGSISGFANSEISDLALTFESTDESTIYIPEVTLDLVNSTYSVSLEPNVTYTITADGVNDYDLTTTSLTITDATTQELAFSAKATYAVTITSSDLTAEQLAAMTITFENLLDEGYSYDFAYTDAMKLRDGTYSVTCSGLNAYAIEQDLTSNLVVNGGEVSKAISFSKVSEWDFTSSESISNATAYKGLVFGGSGAVTLRGTDMYAASTATVDIPVSTGQKILISTYYQADYSIGDSTFVNSTKSTSAVQTNEYYYSGTTDGTMTLTVNSDTYTGSYFLDIQVVDVMAYTATLYVGTDKEYTTISDALDAVARMSRTEEQRVTIMIDPGNYEEMLVIDQDNVTLTNASATPSIALTDNGVNIDAEAVRITSYYGHGYNYYSMESDQKWHADVLAVNKANGYVSYENKGSGTTNGSYWNATVVVKADGFRANNIIFENSFNQYISLKESQDVVEANENDGMAERPTTYGAIDVQEKSYVERAAGIAIASGDKTILNNCRVVGHQDSFYGAVGSRVAVYKGVMMGGTDYIFGGMVAVFYKSDLALTTSDDGNDVAYITAAQQSSGRGYLMYKCNIVSATPGADINSEYDYSKPGYFGRPWQASTSEVVFFKTNIAACQNSSYTGQSLINAAGWLSTLGGESAGMCEYQSVEESGVDNTSSRATWATTSATGTSLSDETTISLFNFTKGTDDWDPFTDYELDEGETTTGISAKKSDSSVNVYAYENQVVVTNVTSQTTISVYNLSGVLIKTKVVSDTDTFTLPQGCYIVKVQDATGVKSVKVVTYN